MLLFLLAMALAATHAYSGVHVGVEIHVAVFNARTDDGDDTLHREVRPKLAEAFPDAMVVRDDDWDEMPQGGIVIRIEMLEGESHTSRVAGVGSDLRGRLVVVTSNLPSEATVRLRVTATDTRSVPPRIETIDTSFTRRNETASIFSDSEDELRDAALDRCVADVAGLLLRFPSPGVKLAAPVVPERAPSSTRIVAAQLYAAAGRDDATVSDADVTAVWARIRAGASVDDLLVLAKASKAAGTATLDELLSGGVR